MRTASEDPPSLHIPRPAPPAVAYPFDTVRRRLMMQAGKAVEKREYANTLDCWHKIIKNEGARGLMKGAGTNVVRGAGAALVLPLFDEIKKVIAAGAPTAAAGR